MLLNADTFLTAAVMLAGMSLTFIKKVRIISDFATIFTYAKPPRGQIGAFGKTVLSRMLKPIIVLISKHHPKCHTLFLCALNCFQKYSIKNRSVALGLLFSIINTNILLLYYFHPT